MNRRLACGHATLGVLVVLFAATPAVQLAAVTESASDGVSYVQSIEAWRAARVAWLTSEAGWLTLIALHWLEEGENSFGRGKANAFALDHPALQEITGSFFLGDGKVRFVARPGSNVTSEGKAVAALNMAPDVSGEPTVLAVGSLRVFVIGRVGRLAVRVRDLDHAPRRNFRGIEYFPIDPEWAIEARFEPYEKGRTVPILNVMGMMNDFAAPGALVFVKDGQEYRLDALLESPDAKELLIMFADATSARETYGAGRFLYLPLPPKPGEKGQVLLDFNRSYNPPCAFSEFATCPLPPPQNRLGLRVTAGEKKYGAH